MDPLKNMYSIAAARRIAKALKRGDPRFPEPEFLSGLESQLNKRELKERVGLLAERINRALHGRDFPTKVRIFLKALSQGDSDPVGLQGFLVWPLSSLIAQEGLEHFDVSLSALKETTKRFTAEFDIRPFLEKDERRCLRLLEAWAHDPDPRVRRLVSEGTRPLLPWGKKLAAFQKDPGKTLHLLEKLRFDEDLSVRKSVANHLNDHSKTHPDWLVDLMSLWKKTDPRHEGVAWIVRHGSRTLIKSGHPAALRLQGVPDGKHLRLSAFRLLARSVRIGGSLGFQAKVTNRSSKPRLALIDYVVHFKKADGGLSPKVFKGRKKRLEPGETWAFEARHPFRVITTRRYFVGGHGLALKINGQETKPLAFILQKAEKSL